ncbi:MAG TPA: flagellar biosynthetic protein FliR [Bacteroidota bacterium]|nr:flagellar biosynthetic protein FliR [Bacteroidota bacterium]
MDIYVSQFVLYVLIFARVMSLIVVAPVVSHQAVPVQVKIALGLFVALVMQPIVAATHPVIDQSLAVLTIMVLKEIAVGLLLGFAAGFILLGAVVAGEMISLDLGMSLATVLDPESGAQNTVMSQFLQLVMTLVFLLLNGHHFVLQALRMSFDAVGIGQFTISTGLTDRLVALAGAVLVVGIKLAAPVIVASFIVNVALGVLARVTPQINVFILNFQVKIGIGFLLMMTAAPMMVYVFKKLLAGFEENMVDLVRAL